MNTVTTCSDVHGNPVSGSPAAISRYDAAVDDLLAYRESLVDAMTSLVDDEPDFPMGLVLASYLTLTSTDAPDVPGAAALAARLGALTLDEREAAHRDAIDTWVAGDWHGAARRLDAILVRWPADLLGLVVGHLLDFFLGDAANLRDRIGRSLTAIDPSHPHHGYVRGMFSFGLEESGNYQLAEHHGLAAVDRNPDDVWAIHAVTHVYEMQGRIDEGIRFLRSRQADWGDGNLFSVHNWWHLAVYLLEADRSGESLAIYDRHIHHEQSAGVPLEMLDASALLWRLHLDGIGTGDRFDHLADAWATRATDEPWYAFNDLHAVMALAGAGRLTEARAVISRLERYVTTAAPSSNVRITAEVGLPTCRAVLAHVEGHHGSVVAELAPIRTILSRFGGSHAQRDALQRTLVVSAIRHGQLDLAQALLDERLAVRDTSAWSWRRRGEVRRAIGDADGAELAGWRAAAHSTADPDQPHQHRHGRTRQIERITMSTRSTITHPPATAGTTAAELHVETWGDGDPVVLVHGSLATGAEEWECQRPLAAEGFRLLVFDRRGYGRSPAAVGEDFEADAADIAELMGDGAHLVGHSYGGLGAMLAAAGRPEATHSLTLLESPAAVSTAFLPSWKTLDGEIRDLWDRDLPDDEWVVRFLRAVGSDPDQYPAEVLAQAVPLVPVFRRGRPYFTFEPPLDALAAADFPKLVVSGGHSAAFDAMCEALARRIGAAHLVVAGAGHEIQFTGEPANEALLTLWRQIGYRD